MIDERGFAVPFPFEVRFVAGDDAFLSPAGGRDTCYIAVHMYRGMEWEPYFRAVEEVMEAFGGRPHWGKRHFQTAATLAPRYPEWKRFAAVRARLDPEGRFANRYVERVLGPVGERLPACISPRVVQAVHRPTLGSLVELAAEVGPDASSSATSPSR